MLPARAGFVRAFACLLAAPLQDGLALVGPNRGEVGDLLGGAAPRWTRAWGWRAGGLPVAGRLSIRPQCEFAGCSSAPGECR
eukprot:10236957-Alexandrium_andersonii.AAC.1